LNMGTKGIQTRQQIVNKSLQLFSVKGYFNTSICNILEATHLTKGGLYGHFRSKEAIWNAVYEEAVMIWRGIVFKDVRKTADPLKRIEKTIENALKNYLGADVFEGGCFFANMLVELSGQSAPMSKKVLLGFIGFSRLFRSWLEEADKKGLVKKRLNFKEIADFIVISINGAVTLYSAARDPDIWKQTISQLKFYINQLKIEKEDKG
jgi:TetR/AcrR family transcriptional regulator, transcriptional repressor for nem operon